MSLLASRRYLTVGQVAEMLQLTKSAVAKRAERGLLPGATKIGKLWRFREDRLTAWLDEQERRQIDVMNIDRRSARPRARAVPERAAPE